MGIPDFQALMRPTLEQHANVVEIHVRDLRQQIADVFKLSEDDITQLLPSGRQRTFDNRVAWAVTYLAKSGLLQRTRRGVTAITDRGRAALEHHPERIDIRILEQFEEFHRFRAGSGTSTDNGDASGVPVQVKPKALVSGTRETASAEAPPTEIIEEQFAKLRADLAAELLGRLVELPPEDFEQVVVDVLVAMGYGGSRKEAGERTRISRDGGIDGVIREDALGLDAIYLQAKRYARDRTVGRPDVQAFVGALQGEQASKGVFLTTGSFSRDATQYAESVSPRVVLVDGDELAGLMIDHGVGVLAAQTYVVSRLDEDYFTGPV